jgi:hypothetical protein
MLGVFRLIECIGGGLMELAMRAFRGPALVHVDQSRPLLICRGECGSAIAYEQTIQRCRGVPPVAGCLCSRWPISIRLMIHDRWLGRSEAEPPANRLRVLNRSRTTTRPDASQRAARANGATNPIELQPGRPLCPFVPLVTSCFNNPPSPAQPPPSVEVSRSLATRTPVQDST